MRRRHGNALILVLGIALLLAIQVYIIQTFTMGSFRHVEKVNAHIRAIYVGEAAFSTILAKLKADTWENRWFRGLPDGFRDFSQPMAGGTYSSVVVDVVNPPGVTDKLIDVWLESRYDGSTQLMYYRVLYADDTLDFTAQVYPRFFTFLEASDPNPFTGDLAPSIAHIKQLIDTQANNEPAALAAIAAVKNSCDLAGVGTTLGVTFPAGPPQLDALTPVGGVLTPLCPYVNSVNGTLVSLLGLPPSLPLPPLPPTPLAGNDFVSAVVAAFATAGATLPTAKGAKITDPNALALVAVAKDAQGQWKTEHQSKNYQHYMKTSEMLGFIGNMLDKRDANPLAPEAITVNTIVTQLLAWVSSQSVAHGGRVYAAPSGLKADFISEFLATQSELPPLIPEFRSK